MVNDNLHFIEMFAKILKLFLFFLNRIYDYTYIR